MSEYQSDCDTLVPSTHKQWWHDVNFEFKSFCGHISHCCLVNSLLYVTLFLAVCLSHAHTCTPTTTTMQVAMHTHIYIIIYIYN